MITIIWDTLVNHDLFQEREMSGKAATELLEHSLAYQQNAVGSGGAIRSNTSWQDTMILYPRPTALE